MSAEAILRSIDFVSCDLANVVRGSSPQTFNDHEEVCRPMSTGLTSKAGTENNILVQTHVAAIKPTITKHYFDQKLCRKNTNLGKCRVGPSQAPDPFRIG